MRPWIFVSGLLLLAALAIGATLIRAEWQRIELERGLNEATRATRVRSFTREGIRRAALTFLHQADAQIRSDQVQVDLAAVGVPDRPLAIAADQLRERDNPTGKPVTLSIRAQAEINTWGWRHTVRLETEQQARVDPKTLGAYDRAPRAEAARAPDAKKPAAISLDKRPGIVPLLALLNTHSATRRKAKTAPPAQAAQRKLLSRAEEVAPYVTAGELRWTRSEMTISSYVTALRELERATDTEVAWSNASALGEAVSRDLARLGIYTPPVDPLGASGAQ